MKILAITPLQNISIFGIRAGNTARIRPDESFWRDWRFTVRGPSVFVESPPGWKNGSAPDGKQRQVCQIPLCVVEWSLEEGERVEDLVGSPQQQVKK